MPSILRIALALLTLAAIGLQWTIHVGASHPSLNFFSYFTNLSNLFACGVLLFSAWPASSAHARARDVLRYLSAVNMAVVGIVFAILLRDVDLGDLLPWINTVLHYLMPCAVVADWLLRGPSTRLDARHWALALVFPTAYLAYVLLRGTATGWYPYPFLNPANVGGAGGVALYAVAIALTFMAVGAALLALGRRRQRRVA